MRGGTAPGAVATPAPSRALSIGAGGATAPGTVPSLFGQRLFGNLGLSRIEARAELQRPPQILLSGRPVPRGSRNHSGVVKQLRVLRAQSQGVLGRLPRLVNLSGFERRPGQGVRAVNVAPRFIFTLSELISFAWFQIVVGVKERELAIV